MFVLALNHRNKVSNLPLTYANADKEGHMIYRQRVSEVPWNNLSIGVPAEEAFERVHLLDDYFYPKFDAWDDTKRKRDTPFLSSFFLHSKPAAAFRDKARHP